MTRIDARSLRAWAPWLYLLSLGGLVAVLSPLGSTVNGSRSWIRLPGGFSVQPSEFAKVAICVGMAMILAERRDRDLGPGRRDIVLAALVALVPIALVMLQPDLGSAVVLGAMAFGVLAVAGAPKRLLAARGDPFGQLMSVGVAVWFAVQAFENIGMNLGITPVTGLPLPFLSYGGSSMFVGWLALGLVNNVHLSAGRR